jgi:alpha-L-fucosidase
MKYVVFTAKHHSGFCMFRTATTDFNVTRTPFGRDATGEILSAFRDQGVAPGLYISPDDFHWFHENGHPIARPPAPNTTTREVPGLLEYGKRQLKELLGNYGKVDLLFIDGPADGLREYGWELNPDLVVTRGALETPEQSVPEITLDAPWESCLTMGTGWQHKPTNETYKSGTELIRILIEVRAKGGNLLLNVGPTADGEIFREEEARLRELALWNMANGEAIEAVRPWVVPNEGDIWFTRKKSEPTVYAFLTGDPMKLGERRAITLRSVRATAATQVGVLGQSGEILEYRPNVVPRTTWKQTPGGLEISAVRAQRLYNNRRWPNPIVLKITHAAPALAPPKVATAEATWDSRAGCYMLDGELADLGTAARVEVGFQYRRRKAMADLYEPVDTWKQLPLAAQAAPGRFSRCLAGVPRDADAEFRAMARQPLTSVYGRERPVNPGAVVRLH